MIKERIALFPGSFNPFTLGHLDIVARGLKLFDKIIVAIGYNEHKVEQGVLSERITEIKSALADMKNVSVMAYSGLTVEFARENGCCALLRGVRSCLDFEYEKNMADTNSAISEIETIFLPARADLAFLSSSMVRELSHNGYDVSRFLPQKPS